MIELQGIERRFQVGDETVYGLRGIDLSVPNGDYLSIMGPSGSGKSTLLNMLGLLDRPDAGRYQLEGTETTEQDEDARAALRQHHIGFVFQAFHLIPRLTAAENIGLPMVLAGIPADMRNARVQEVLAAMGLVDRAQHTSNQLSGGQRQRVAIGRAIVMQPQVLLADEPTGNLDQHSGIEVIKVLEQLNTQGITLVVVTHDPIMGARARRRVRMLDGAIESDE